MKRSCWSCKALELSQNTYGCKLGYPQTDQVGGTQVAIKPTVQCPKPLTVKEFVRLITGGRTGFPVSTPEKRHA